MDIKLFLLLTAAFLTFIVAPIALVWTFVDGMKRKSSDRSSGGGGISNFVGAGLQEVDRLIARPSIEHQIETENPVLKREGDDGK